MILALHCGVLVSVQLGTARLVWTGFGYGLFIKQATILAHFWLWRLIVLYAVYFLISIAGAHDASLELDAYWAVGLSAPLLCEYKEIDE